MSKIVYKPHCEQCGALIEQKIQIKRTVLEIGNSIHWIYHPADYTFDPHQCENCGAIFDLAEFQPPEEVEDF